MSIEPLPFGLSWRWRDLLRRVWLRADCAWAFCVDLNDGATAATGSGSSANVFRIQCLAGTVWVTQQGDPRDHLLRSGDTWQPQPGGRVVVQALGSARICVSAC